MPIDLLDPASDLAAALDTQTPGGVTLALGSNLFAGQFHPMPQLAVFCLASGGPPPTPYLNPTPSAVFEQDVQVLVRGAPGAAGYAQAWALARGVFGLVQQQTFSGYVSWLAQGMPVYVADPDNGGHTISINFRARYTAAYYTPTPPIVPGGGPPQA